MVQRLTWEATREFGLMQTHGRTMEPAGSACLGWDEARVSATVDGLRARLHGIDLALLDLTDDELKLWIYGFLHRHRLRGALDHPYLNAFASNGFGESTHSEGQSQGARPFLRRGITSRT